jgi:hypothetical protein
MSSQDGDSLPHTLTSGFSRNFNFPGWTDFQLQLSVLDWLPS